MTYTGIGIDMIVLLTIKGGCGSTLTPLACCSSWERSLVGGAKKAAYCYKDREVKGQKWRPIRVFSLIDGHIASESASRMGRANEAAHSIKGEIALENKLLGMVRLTV